jgi:hypothetical protein
MAWSVRCDDSRGMETNQMSAHWSATAVEVDSIALLCALLVGIAEGGEGTSELALAGAMESRQRLPYSEARLSRLAGRKHTDGRLGAAAKIGNLRLVCTTLSQVRDE